MSKTQTRTDNVLNNIMLDRILKETLAVIEHSKEDIFNISESAKNETRRLSSELEHIREEIRHVIDQVDRLELMFKRSRVRLMEVSKEFSRFSEADIKAAYDSAQKVQLQLAVEKEKEKNLRKRRDELERSMANVEEMVKRAEELVSKVDLALTFLSGNLNLFNTQVSSISDQQRQWIGGRIILAQEEERRRVAREIHDGPAQAMANVVLRAEFCEKLLRANRPEVEEELGDLKKVVKDSLKEVRRIIFNLRPMTLDDLGLVPTLRRYAEEFRDREGIDAVITVRGEEKRLPASIEVTVFRLVQEALNNIKKHAGVDQAQIVLEITPQWVRLEVSDQGKGFDPVQVHDEVSGKKSFGLLSMKERITLLEGEFQLESTPGTGTIIRASIPIQDETDSETTVE